MKIWRKKLKTYELMVIIKPNIDSEETDKVIEKISANVAELGGKVLETEKTGRKKLAYEVKSFRDGFFATLKIELEPAQVSKFTRQLSLNEAVLRTMFLELAKA